MMPTLLDIPSFLLLFVMPQISTQIGGMDLNSPKCINNILANPFKNCTPTTSEKQMKNILCKKNFRISVKDLKPYTERFRRVLKGVLEFCCGNKVNYTENFLDEKASVTDNGHTMMTSDILHPILSYTKQEQSHGHFFIPLLDAPVGYFYQHRPSTTKTTLKLILACLRLWPLGTICLMMALIAGFIVWATETWINVHQFPRPFLSGVFEGFWWSFISMTTVGYGDKYPKSCCARIFAVVWILIGITVCSMFTASLTSAISGVQPSATLMSGKKIGVLYNRKYDSLVVMRHGGTPIETHNNSADVSTLLTMLRNQQVDGIFIDKHVCSHKGHWKELHHLARAEFSYDGEQLSYGVLVMNKSDFTYFNEFIRDNRITLEQCVAKDDNTTSLAENAEADFSVFSPNMFLKSFLGTGGIIAVVAVFGCIYEIKRRKGQWTTVPTWCRWKAGADGSPMVDLKCGFKSPKPKPRSKTHRNRNMASSAKEHINKSPEELTQLVISKDMTKMIKKWKADGMV